jgi:flagellar biosynthesis protein FliR
MMLPEAAAAAAARAAGAAFFAPAFTSIPWRMRLAFAVAAGWVAAPVAAGDRSLADISIAWVAMEAATGAVIGLLAAIAVEALRVAGHLIGQQMGWSIAPTYDPAVEGEANAAESLLSWSAVAIFVAIGGVQSIVLVAAASVRTLAPGGFLRAEVAASAPPLLDAAMRVGLTACLPVAALLGAVSGVAALVVRVAPGVSTFAAGFGPRAVLGLAATAATCAVSWSGESAFLRDALQRVAAEVVP